MEQNKREQFIICSIGGTTYKVRVVFNENGGETMEDTRGTQSIDAAPLSPAGVFPYPLLDECDPLCGIVHIF